MSTTTNGRPADGPDVIAPRSIRYRLSGAEAAAAVHLVGVQPDGSLLGPVGAVDDPRPVLRAAGLVGDDGDLHPFLGEALTVAARPSRVVHVLASAPGAEEWIDLRVGAASRGGPYVTVGPSRDGGEPGAIDLHAVETSMEIAAVLDDLLRLTAYPTRPVDPDVALTLPAWLGLLAAVDVRRLRRLRDELRRRPESDEPMSITDLEGALTVGLTATDSRWAVSAAVPIAPVPLRERAPTAAQAASEMVTLGVLEHVDGGYALTTLGRDLADVVDQTILFGSLTLIHQRDGRPVRGGELIVHRAPTRLLVGLWTGSRESPVVTLMEPSSEAAVGMVRRFLELVDEPAAAPPADADVSGPPFDASHRVGDGGARAWRGPDAASDPIGTLAGGTAVSVLTTHGAWSHVRTADGWEGWIDGRQLIRI